MYKKDVHLIKQKHTIVPKGVTGFSVHHNKHGYTSLYLHIKNR